jgi:acetyl esterase/lipase
VELKTWHRMPHVFPMFADVLPEGRRALDEIGAFIDARLARAANVR